MLLSDASIVGTCANDKPHLLLFAINAVLYYNKETSQNFLLISHMEALKGVKQYERRFWGVGRYSGELR